VLIIIAVIGIAYVTVSKLKAKNDNQNTNLQTTSQPSDNASDTQMNTQDIENPGSLNDQNSSSLNQDLFNEGSTINPDGSIGSTDNSNRTGTTTLPQSELGL